MSALNPIELQKYLAGIDYPCSRDDVVRVARDNGADDAVLGELEKRPDASFDGPDAVNKAVF